MTRLIVDDGFDRSWIAHLEGPEGADVAFAGSEPLAAEVLRYLGDPAAFAPEVSWADPDTDDVRVAISAAQVAAAGPGTYRLRVWPTVSGSPLLAVDEALEIRALSANVARLALESSIYGQSGPTLVLVGLEQAVGAETRALDLPIARALAGMGLPPTSFVSVSDSDLTAIPAYAQGQFHDLLGEHVLGLILDRWDKFDYTAGSENSQKLGALRDSIEKSLVRVQKLNAIRYTPGSIVPDPGATPPVQGDGRLRVGRVNLNIYAGRGRDREC